MVAGGGQSPAEDHPIVLPGNRRHSSRRHAVHRAGGRCRLNTNRDTRVQGKHSSPIPTPRVAGPVRAFVQPAQNRQMITTHDFIGLECSPNAKVFESAGTWLDGEFFRYSERPNMNRQDLNDRLPKIVNLLVDSVVNEPRMKHLNRVFLPSRDEIVHCIACCANCCFPGISVSRV